MENAEALLVSNRNARISKLSRMKLQKYIFIYSCLFLPLLFFIAIRILPILSSFQISVHEWDLLSEVKPFVGADNFITLWNDPVFRAALRNTFVYVLLGVPGQLIAGLAVALLLQKIHRARGFFRLIYFIPYVTSIVAAGWVFRWILMRNGIANSILIDLGFSPQLFLGSQIQAIYLIIGVMIWHGLGFQMLIFLAGLEQIPREYYDAAAMDGAGAWRRFLHITLPLLNPVIVFSVVIGSISYIQEFTWVQNMTGGGPLNSTVSLVLYIYELAFKHFRMGEAAAATVVLFLIILLLSLLQFKFLNKKTEY